MYGRAGGSAQQYTQHWRADMELANAYAQADAMLVANGAMKHVAGPLYFPVGRTVRPATSAGGEHAQAPVP